MGQGYHASGSAEGGSAPAPRPRLLTDPRDAARGACSNSLPMRLGLPALVSLALGVSLAAVAGLAVTAGAGPESPRAQAVARATRPLLVVVATPHDERARRSEVRSVGPDGVGIPLGAVQHAPGAVVRGDLLGALPVVVADEEAAADRDFGAALFAVERQGVRRLVAGVGHARRPLASADGLVYVERGSSGAAPASGARVDRLELAAVEPTTGDVRVLYTYSGCALHLAGELGPDLVVYRVAAAGGADVLLVGRASGRSRLVASIVPMARDFTVDRERGALLYVNRDAKDAALWAVERLDLASGLVTRLATARDDAPAPYALPSSDPVWTAPGRRGLASARGEWLAPLGPGFDAVRATSPDGAWLAVLHVPSEGMDDLALLHAPAGPRGPLGPGGVARLGGAERVEALGFVGGESAR